MGHVRLEEAPETLTERRRSIGRYECLRRVQQTADVAHDRIAGAELTYECKKFHSMSFTIDECSIVTHSRDRYRAVPWVEHERRIVCERLVAMERPVR